jgi:hypothetical protein
MQDLFFDEAEKDIGEEPEPETAPPAPGAAAPA